jgi:hypothetical protein
LLLPAVEMLRYTLARHAGNGGWWLRRRQLPPLPKLFSTRRGHHLHYICRLHVDSRAGQWRKQRKIFSAAVAAASRNGRASAQAPAMPRSQAKWPPLKRFALHSRTLGHFNECRTAAVVRLCINLLLNLDEHAKINTSDMKKFVWCHEWSSAKLKTLFIFFYWVFTKYWWSFG